jgi:hypothetical protein
MLQNKLGINAKTPKKKIQLRSIQPHTAKKTLISIDASPRDLRLKASVGAEEVYAVLAYRLSLTKR